ncbi:protein A16-like [Anopheles maculipalpis]|uniref:protein A16-like n=1 Tax=Anopheles maculipalpis TaxID=1496333 RepID=UPI0021596A9F|nr:protein A16-like [Anopheles maculipalpis]
MSFDRTLFSSFLGVLFVVTVVAASATKLETVARKVATKNSTRDYSNSAVNNFPVNGLPPLTYSPKKYTFYGDGVTFFEAWNLCRSKGKRLAAIETYQDHLTFQEAVIPNADYDISYWIAATNIGAHRDQYEQFYWITNDRPIGYLSGFANWIDGVAPNEESLCVAAYLGSALWIYGDCESSTSAYACEEPKDV